MIQRRYCFNTPVAAGGVGCTKTMPCGLLNYKHEERGRADHPVSMRHVHIVRGRRTALCPLPSARACRPAAHPDGSGRAEGGGEGGEAAHTHTQRSAQRSAQRAAEHEAERPGSGGGEHDARHRRPACRSLAERRAE